MRLHLIGEEMFRTPTTYGGSAGLLGGLASGLGARIQTWVGGLFYLRDPKQEVAWGCESLWVKMLILITALFTVSSTIPGLRSFRNNC